MNECKNYLLKKKLSNNIKQEFSNFKYFLIFCFLYLITIQIKRNKDIINNKVNKLFISEITNEFNKNGKVNINNIEKRIMNDKDNKNLNFDKMIYEIKNIINITLDPGFIYQTMLTVTSIMANQKSTTKVIFHFGVVKRFTTAHMLKIYSLKNKINNLTEFNFYYLKKSMIKMKNFHSQGEACPGKFELPELLPDNIHKLLLFDAGDVLIFRDLSELYNYDIHDCWAIGTPEPLGIQFTKKYNKTIYINIGSILLNVKELKKKHFFDYYANHRYLKLIGAPDQELFNILVPDNKLGYFPFRFGGITPFFNDLYSDQTNVSFWGIEEWLHSNLSINLPENPKELYKYISQLFNPVFVHQITEKWKYGSGLSIYRNLAKYYIKLSGIEAELCLKDPGFCE